MEISTEKENIEMMNENQLKQQAINLINGDRENLYNRLRQHALMECKISQEEFDSLWNKAFDSIDTYGNGNVEEAIKNLDIEIAELKSQQEKLKNADWREFIPEELKKSFE